MSIFVSIHYHMCSFVRPIQAQMGDGERRTGVRKQDGYRVITGVSG